MSEPQTPILTKEDLEREKLLLEITELKRYWWKKPAYIAAVFPTLLAITTLVYGFTNGYFQAQFVKLENQKHDLQVEVTNFSEKRDEAKREVDRLNAQLKEIRQSVENIQTVPDLVNKAEEIRPINRKKK